MGVEYPEVQEDEFEEQALIEEEGGVNYYLDFHEQPTADP
jgi:hypothetical protein